MNSDESEIRTVVRVRIPHKNDDKFAPSEYLHSQLFTCVNKGKYKSMKKFPIKYLFNLYNEHLSITIFIECKKVKL